MQKEPKNQERNMLSTLSVQMLKQYKSNCSAKSGTRGQAPFVCFYAFVHYLTLSYFRSVRELVNSFHSQTLARISFGLAHNSFIIMLNRIVEVYLSNHLVIFT